MSTSRIQLALNVENVAEATAFYELACSGRPAHKQRDGYANFVIEDPPLKLVLIENPGSGGGLNHLGVEAPAARGTSPRRWSGSRPEGSTSPWPSRICAATPCRTRCSSPPQTFRWAGGSSTRSPTTIPLTRTGSRRRCARKTARLRTRPRASAASDHRQESGGRPSGAGHRDAVNRSRSPRRCHRRGRACSPRDAAGVEGELAALPEQHGQAPPSALHPRLHTRQRHTLNSRGGGLRSSRRGRPSRRPRAARVQALPAADAGTRPARPGPRRVVVGFLDDLHHHRSRELLRARPARRYSSTTALRATRDTQCANRSRSSRVPMLRRMRSRMPVTRSSARSGSAMRRCTNTRSWAMTSRHVCSGSEPALAVTSVLIFPRSERPGSAPAPPYDGSAERTQPATALPPGCRASRRPPTSTSRLRTSTWRSCVRRGHREVESLTVAAKSGFPAVRGVAGDPLAALVLAAASVQAGLRTWARRRC